jgi:putative oxidoreductase
MLDKFFETRDDVGLLVARLALGIVFLPHGLQKTLGLFGGAGFSGTMGFFTQEGMPSIIAFLIIIGESFGALGLIIGFLSRLAAFGISLIMLGAIFMVHLPNGFFMNWFGTKQGEGFEFHILAIGLGLVVLIGGAGKWSVDRLLVKD